MTCIEDMDHAELNKLLTTSLDRSVSVLSQRAKLIFVQWSCLNRWWKSILLAHHTHSSNSDWRCGSFASARAICSMFEPLESYIDRVNPITQSYIPTNVSYISLCNRSSLAFALVLSDILVNTFVTRNDDPETRMESILSHLRNHMLSAF
jgi:hypothetical protein